MAKWFEDEGFSNKVCKLVYENYERLGKKGKPLAGREWTILAAVVAVFDEGQENDYRLELISLGSGSKCLGRNQLSTTGNLLNDSHAEVIARRGFLRYIYQELQNCYGSKESIFMSDKHTKKCSLKNSISFHLFTSHTPCGDASIFPKGGDSTMIIERRKKRKNISLLEHDSKYICMDNENVGKQSDNGMGQKRPTFSVNLESSALPSEDNVCTSDIYRTGAKCVPGGQQDLHDVGSGFHNVGVLRTKPGRGDPTLSMSCSDKIMKWCVLGCQGALISYFLEKPIYLASIVLGKCTYDPGALRRALFERTSAVGPLPKGYQVKELRLLPGDMEFEGGKRRAEEIGGKTEEEKLTPSPSAIIMIRKPSVHEVAINGLKQGVTKSNRDSQKSRLCICKIELFNQFKAVLAMSQVSRQEVQSSKTYKQFKDDAFPYNKAKESFCTVFSTWLEKPSYLEQFTE
ncbi:tRNA-specific adenosine deaminase 1-like [Dendronephthya gigantea]|uniref:tRNA-specific adenosine deaminase 1-like n=1 Tax=Dendronephthya gigantea TaxID=151771 RepID=UPI00106C0A70|nr:tRNA-specific adenosine deaminase 1-like [Dendronephthya gigantea]XP_028391809.1 tRNA-specific adenosine deaminase 1-like [Dendronephthya gigantea]